jgi:glycosyltransferase involved in cell wall biosynthesis
MGSRLRVAQVIWSLDPVAHGGGSDYYGLRLALQLDPQQYACSVCALWQYGTPTENEWLTRLTRHNLRTDFLVPRTASVTAGQRAEAFRAFAAYVKQRQPAVVNCHAEAADPLVAYARLTRPGSTVFVRTAHAEREWVDLPMAGLLLRQAGSLLYDQEAGVSQQVVQRLNRRPLARWLRRPAFYMPNGIDLDEIAAAPAKTSLRDELGIPPRAFLIGSVGRLETQKGYTVLLRAFKQISTSGVEAYLVLAGAGSLQGALSRQIRALQLQGRACLLGARPDRLSLIRQFDVFVSSSLWEGMPTVVLEALAVDTPVIATRVSGSLELILDGQTGLLVPPGDADACARALLGLCQDPHKRKQLAEAARASIGQFAFAQTVRKYEALYENLILSSAAPLRAGVS